AADPPAPPPSPAPAPAPVVTPSTTTERPAEPSLPLGTPPTGIETPSRTHVEPRPQAPEINPYAPEPPFRPRRNPARTWTLLAVAVAVLLLAGAVAVAWFGPRLFAGWAGSGATESPLMLQVVRKPERRTLATGNELFAVSGRIVNPTGVRQRV